MTHPEGASRVVLAVRDVGRSLGFSSFAVSLRLTRSTGRGDRGCLVRELRIGARGRGLCAKRGSRRWTLLNIELSESLLCVSCSCGLVL